MRAVIVGASSGLGRSIGVALAQQGVQVALLARRMERLEHAVAEAGSNAVAIECDVTDQQSIATAIAAAAEKLGGIDGLLYAPGIGPLSKLVDLDAETWQQVFATNVTGAALVTAAAMPHLEESAGRAVYLSSVSASQTAPWPGLGAYVVSKAALDKMVEAWQGEHPHVAFTRLVVGDCMGGTGDSQSGFAMDWDPDLVAEVFPIWIERHMLSGSFIDIEAVISIARGALEGGPSYSTPTIVVAPRPIAGGEPPLDVAHAVEGHLEAQFEAQQHEAHSD